MTDNTRMVSPKEIMEAAKTYMLEGQEPKTEIDWAKVANFVAVNLHPSIGCVGLKLFMQIYQSPLPEDYLEEVWDYQTNRR